MNFGQAAGFIRHATAFQLAAGLPAVPEDAEVAWVLDLYLAGLEAGHPVDPERLLTEHPAIAEPEEVGTFGGARAGIRNLKENAAVFPLRQLGVFGFVNIHHSLSAFGLVQIAAHDHEGSMLVVKNKWVPPVINFLPAMQ